MMQTINIFEEHQKLKLFDTVQKTNTFKNPNN